MSRIHFSANNTWFRPFKWEHMDRQKTDRQTDRQTKVKTVCPQDLADVKMMSTQTRFFKQLHGIIQFVRIHLSRLFSGLLHLLQLFLFLVLAQTLCPIHHSHLQYIITSYINCVSAAWSISHWINQPIYLTLWDNISMNNDQSKKREKKRQWIPRQVLYELAHLQLLVLSLQWLTNITERQTGTSIKLLAFDS